MDKTIPDVISTLPTNVIKVNYPSGVSVNLGNELTPLQVKDEPTLEWSTETGALYTVIMLDPDVAEDIRAIKHWLIVNVPDNDLSKGELLAPYVGSRPPQDSGLHRYIFLVYKQLAGHLYHTEVPLKPNDRLGRRKFSAKQFAKRYNLGEPYAGNLFVAKADDYSNQLWAEINKPKLD
ncbi:protein D1-like [Oppia nitens]|uniref:protein D1-like n=1 Tax=Oppia nitens TaxID=1686743 RepID=UPI0023DC5992|nr:protein D1-like [Oppia nitens]